MELQIARLRRERSYQVLNYTTDDVLVSIDQPVPVGDVLKPEPSCVLSSLAHCEGLRFTLDGHFLIAAISRSGWLSAFNPLTGKLSHLLAEGLISAGHKDLEISPHGELIVSTHKFLNENCITTI